MNFGTVVIDEQIMEIESARFWGGGVEITITVPEGVAWEAGERDWILFGADGEQVVRGRLADKGEKVPTCTWRLTLQVYFTDKMTERVRAREIQKPKG